MNFAEIDEAARASRGKLIRSIIVSLDHMDELSATLRCHIFLEQEINELIKDLLPKPAKILKWYLSDKLEILSAFNILPLKTANKFKIINNLRNNFSHDYEYKFSQNDIRLLKSIDNPTNIEVPKELAGIHNIYEVYLLIAQTAYLQGCIAGIRKRRHLASTAKSKALRSKIGSG